MKPLTVWAVEEERVRILGRVTQPLEQLDFLFATGYVPRPCDLCGPRLPPRAGELSPSSFPSFVQGNACNRIDLRSQRCWRAGAVMTSCWPFVSSWRRTLLPAAAANPRPGVRLGLRFGQGIKLVQLGLEQLPVRQSGLVLGDERGRHGPAQGVLDDLVVLRGRAARRSTAARAASSRPGREPPGRTPTSLPRCSGWNSTIFSSKGPSSSAPG